MCFYHQLSYFAVFEIQYLLHYWTQITQHFADCFTSSLTLPRVYKGKIPTLPPKRFFSEFWKEDSLADAQTFSSCSFNPRRNFNESTVSLRHFILPRHHILTCISIQMSSLLTEFVSFLFFLSSIAELVNCTSHYHSGLILHQFYVIFWLSEKTVKSKMVDPIWRT